jgi:hypothetical protein
MSPKLKEFEYFFLKFWRESFFHICRPHVIETKRHTNALLKSFFIALFFSLSFIDYGICQVIPTGLKFFDNGQPTRTGIDAAMFPDNSTRQKIDLSGTWRYSIDGKNWGMATIPSAYEGTGSVTFMRSFSVSPEMIDKYTFSLVAYGINYLSEISINGNFIGRHMGGYSSFVLPVAQNTLQTGSENSIKIFVDNELSPKTTLPLRQQVGGWKTYGGIFRDIYILATPKLYIENAEVSYDPPKESKTIKLSVRSEIIDRGAAAIAQGELLGYQVEVAEKMSGAVVAKSGILPLSHQLNKSNGITGEVAVPSPKLWSPEAPDLYVVRAEIVRVVNKEATVVDEYDMNVGIRNFEWMNGRLFVNGVLEPLKGIIWNEDHPTYGSALTYEAIEKDITQIKTLGANTIRFQYPPHPYVLNLCDRYGLLVVEEIPVRSVPEEIFGKDYFQDLAATYLKEMIGRDRQHPSILAWGLGEGIEAASSGSCEYITSLRNIVKSLDHRPVYFVSQSISHPCFEYVDILGLSYQGSDRAEFRELLKQWKSKYSNKPLVVMRFGKEVEPGNHYGYSDPLSMEAQARTAMLLFEGITDAKIAGGIFSCYNDWSTDRPTLTTHSHNPYIISMGIVSTDREKRTAFDVIRALYNGEKIQALPVGNYSSNAPVIYVVAGIIALLSFFFLYNGNRRFRDCVNRSLFRTYNFFADVRDQRILLYSHTFFLAIIISITWATLLSSVFYHYRDNLILDNLLSQVLSDGMKEWLVRLIWQPFHFIVVVSLVVFLKLVLLSVVIRLCSMVVRTQVYFYHAFSVTMWSMLPYILLIPVVMVLYRLSMETDFYIVPMVILVGLITVWVFIRLLKGISIIYDVYLFKVYVVSLLIIVVAAGAIYSYLDYTLSTSMYMRYILDSMRHPS